MKEIGCLLIRRQMRDSSIQDRLVQVLQVLQLRHHNHARVFFSLPDGSVNARNTALKRSGFKVSLDHNKKLHIASSCGKNIFTMAKYTFSLEWMKHWAVILMNGPERKVSGNQKFVESVIVDVLKSLDHLPFNHVKSLQQHQQLTIINQVFESARELLQEKQQTVFNVRDCCFPNFIKAVSKVTRLNLGLIAHLIVGCLI